MIEIELGWLLGVIGTLAGVITALAGILWTSMKDRLAVQDKIIEGMREDINRMAKGCGQDNCHWFVR